TEHYRLLLDKGVVVHVRGLGAIGKGVGELIVAALAQVGDMERTRIRERTGHGRELARTLLAASGKTHRERTALGGRLNLILRKFSRGERRTARASN
ncbi:MAG: hypothetical protein J0653_05900, partial [Deltaproteobacteria bacterium]|nr:hypothetical protein [Deltaproteobacteria bacterium]